ncbi:hypothetical protein MTAT_20770 [Moorella thermoacetica]|uniref:Copper amine oxidase-like N-terminal domain-containing protein n=1 Tax=Neomoorella thermoacetica TaxID=1525 RepID=A0AAC9HK28_NEOTH|nr:copper amine oxidase N-terminal domain-containing protein [Moorella thermoacetica]AOQ25315.1 hypothetical protein Maut_02903 [Moorella thermoacetica]TYL11876.1 hypothetical protein MTAT_20770 [Moorella thermoacetica]
MLKTRKKWISILLTLAMLVGLMVPFAGTAGAVGTVYTALEVPTVEDDSTTSLGSFQVEIDPVNIKDINDASQHMAWVELPADFEIHDITVGGTVYNGVGAGSVVTGNAYDSTNSPVAVVTASDFTTGGNGFKLSLGDNSTFGNVNGKIRFTISFDSVKVPAGYSGDIPVTISYIKGQLVSGKVVVAQVGAGALKVSAVKTNSFSDAGGKVKIRVEETVKGKMNATDQLKLELPDGFEWGQVSTATIDDSTETGAKILWGDLANTVPANIYFTPDGDTLKIKLAYLEAVDANGNKYNDYESTQKSAFEFWAPIKVTDPDEAKAGDIVAKVKGDYDVSPSELVVGTYGDYEATIEATDANVTATAGMNDQDISDIKIKEVLSGSLIDGRTITLTLPENARWVKIDDQYVNPDSSKSQLQPNTEIDSDQGLKLVFAGLQGTNDRTAKFTITGTPTSGDNEAELTIENMSVALKAGVTGDLKVTVGGSQGLTGEITVAKVVAPITVTAEKTNVQIGKAAQEAGKIVITESEAGAIDSDGVLTVTLPKDIEFNGTPDVKVTSGDLEVTDVNVVDSASGRNDVLEIEFKDDSNEASTIEISNIKYDINRVLGEGDVEVKIGGSAVVETATQGYWDTSLNPDDFNTSDPFFKSNDYAAKVVNAVCVTPAPVGAKYSASFVIGSTTYTVNGVENTMDVAAYTKDGRTYLPVRYVAYALGITPENILWDGKNATFIGDGRVVQLTPGSAILTINGVPVTMDVTTDLVNGRVMVPFRWVAQAFGAQVNYDEATQTVSIN